MIYTTEGGFRGKYKFLSNMYARPFEYNGIVFSCSEVLYQATKVRDQPELYRSILESNNGYKAKRYAASSPHSYTDEHRIEAMRVALTVKFSCPELRDLLVGTGDVELVEYNTWNDTFWGVYQGKGRNVLGNMLMNLREKLS